MLDSFSQLDKLDLTKSELPLTIEECEPDPETN